LFTTSLLKTLSRQVGVCTTEGKTGNPSRIYQVSLPDRKGPRMNGVHPTLPKVGRLFQPNHSPKERGRRGQAGNSYGTTSTK